MGMCPSGDASDDIVISLGNPDPWKQKMLEELNK